MSLAHRSQTDLLLWQRHNLTQYFSGKSVQCSQPHVLSTYEAGLICETKCEVTLQRPFKMAFSFHLLLHRCFRSVSVPAILSWIFLSYMHTTLLMVYWHLLSRTNCISFYFLLINQVKVLLRWTIFELWRSWDQWRMQEHIHKVRLLCISLPRCMLGLFPISGSDIINLNKLIKPLPVVHVHVHWINNSIILLSVYYRLIVRIPCSLLLWFRPLLFHWSICVRLSADAKA